MRVFIAVDGSDGSFEAIDQVAPLLRGDRDQLAIYCRPPQVRTKGDQPHDAAHARSALAEAILAEADKRLPDDLRAQHESIVGEHDPRHEIVSAAEKWSADLIVMGARGLSLFQRLLLGSVSRAVVHQSKVPVWIARPRPAGTKHSVLVTCERPSLAAASARLLTQFNWPADTSFTLFTVCTSLVAGRVPEWLQNQPRSPDVEAMVRHWVREHDVEIENQHSQLQEVLRGSPQPLHGARAVVVEGDPANEILNAVAAEKHDLVVVGANRKRSIATAIFGSTSEAVIQHASCSVLVVPFTPAS